MRSVAPALPWYLTEALTDVEARTLLGAFSAVLAALCEDRESGGRPLPSQGIESLVATALSAAECADRGQFGVAFAVTLEALSA